jgi:hypothetical protein
MPRQKRNSPALAKATQRIAGIRSIASPLILGNGLSLIEYELQIQTLQSRLAAYNSLLFNLDESARQIEHLEQELNAYSERMLMSVATSYGKTSPQYLQAGGKPRKPGKKRASREAPAPAPITTIISPSPAKAQTNGKGSKPIAR